MGTQFFPMIGQGNQVVSLPGLPGGPADTGLASPDLLIPPGVRPIMGANDPVAGDNTGTLMPLADPIMPPMPPMPIEVASVALPQDALVQGIQGLELPTPEPPVFPELPPSPGAALPGMEPLAEPLPTSRGFELRPWPPDMEPYDAPSFPLPPPEGYLTPDLSAPPLTPLDSSIYQVSQPEPTPYQPPFFEAPTLAPYASPDLAAPDFLPLAAPDLAAPALAAFDLPATEALTPAAFAVPEIAVPALASMPADLEPTAGLPGEVAAVPLVEVLLPEGLGEPVMGMPLEGSLIPGAEALAQAIAQQTDHEEKSSRFAEERSKLRAPVPQFADGKVLWRQVMGGDWES